MTTPPFTPLQTIYVWPGHTWMFADEHCDEEHRWYGDDFFHMLVRDTLTIDEIEDLVSARLKALFGA